MASRESEYEGLSLWRQIGDSIVQDISNGVIAPGERLPAATDLAVKFGVNRLTVLRAIGHLEEEGVVRVERGRGTFVNGDVLKYRFGHQQRFEQNVLENNRTPSRRLISIEIVPASTVVAEALDVQVGSKMVMIALVAEADGTAISFGQNYLPKARFPKARKAFEAASHGGKRLLSTTAVLKSLGVEEFKRKTVRIRSRRPNAMEAEHLGVPLTEYVFETDVSNVDQDGRLIMFGRTVYASSRVEFVFDC